MTEIASPDPAHPNSTAVNGKDGSAQGSSNPTLSNGQAIQETAESSSELSDADLSELEAEVQAFTTASATSVPHEPVNKDGEPPAKRRRTHAPTPKAGSRKPKPISPPWKKVEADGPSSFTDGGRRKSGRINTLPPDPSQKEDKRITRRSLNQGSPQKTAVQAVSVTPQEAKKVTPKTAPTRTKSSRKLVEDDDDPSPPKSNPPKTKRRRRSSTEADAKPPKSKPAAVGTRRSARHAHDDADATPARPLPKIKLKLRTPVKVIPIVHRDQTTMRPKLAATLEEYFERARDVPVEEGGLLASEDGPRYTDEMAKQDAQTILRIEQEAEPGGFLSEAKCSVYEPEPAEEPARQWAHADHLLAAMGNLRRLMVLERQRHRAMAKKLAQACQAEWRRRNPLPRTAEEAERDEVEQSRARWRQVVKAVAGTWENVKTEVNRQRLAAWEAQEQQRVKAALNEAVNQSEQKLQARRTRLDTHELTDDTEDGDDEGHESSADSENNMSSSDDDESKASVVSDEGLTQEQLREKYANLPTLEVADQDAEIQEETSDESIDMDDDLGSSEEDSESGGESDGETEGEQSGSGLLGLFFNKSELQKMKEGSECAENDAQEPVDAGDARPENGVVSSETVEANLVPTVEPVEAVGVDGEEQVADIVMTEAPRDVDAVEPPGHSPDTDVITNAASASRSQSPPTSDTKPSDIDTASSVELVAARTDSRSASSQPQAIKTDIPMLLRGTLREYQHYGLDWLAGLYANNTNGILADEMGLGKTIQTIALLAHLACHHEVWGPHLVIVPTSVMLNWEMEFKKWCPGFKIMTYYGTQDERKKKRTGWQNDDQWNVCITSYQLVLQDAQVFRRRRWHYMILDEAHNIKNFRSQRWQTLLGFNTRARLLLTGTPLQNNLTELWSLLYFLAPPENGVGGFADLSEFHQWFSRPESQILENGRDHLDDEARAIIANLHKVLRPYLLRRLKADVEKQMPAKYEHVEFCRLSKRQRELYDGFLSRSDTRDTLASGNYMSIINCLMQLRKVCNHPDLFVDRPIMTSFRMQRSVPAGYEITEQLVQKKLLAEKAMSTVCLEFLNLIPTTHEHLSASSQERIGQLSAHRIFTEVREAQRRRANDAYVPLDPTTVKSNMVQLESAGRWARYEELQHCLYLNALRRQQRPIYGTRLVQLLTLDTHLRPFRQRPKVPKEIMGWFEGESRLLHHAVPTLGDRAQSLEMTITKFSCVTPAVVTCDQMPLLLGRKGVHAFEDMNLVLSRPVRKIPFLPKEPPPDPWHEARIRSTIQFPDKRLLQYDCGKLQAMDKLLRKLQSGGHRALIFTQMTKMLDILEQFLNIHGHKYLRLDGSTKIEQRQILTDRFNHDTRILCFILSSRSGGLGINLTGADTVIFYDQDWNPAMDKQCQDRCHRIGQTRDVHIYRLVSEHTIEANILRKASQKQMLDDVVIQEGEFTTDYFNKLSVRDVVGINGEVRANENDVAANEAMDRVLGGPSTTGPSQPEDRVVGRRLEQAEDTEDVAAARLAEKEIQQNDDADFSEQRPTPGATTTTTTTASGEPSTRHGTPREGTEPPSTRPAQSALPSFSETVDAPEQNALGEPMCTIDHYMLNSMAAALEGTPLDLPKDKNKKKSKKGKDTRQR